MVGRGGGLIPDRAATTGFIDDDSPCRYYAKGKTIEIIKAATMNKDDDELLDLTPEEIEADEKRLAEIEAQCQALQQQGWRWSEEDRIKRVLMHPDDPGLNIWYHPYSSEALLSPKLVERLREMDERERQGEGLS